MLGEASTAYTKRPDFDGVAERARTLLGPHLRVVYLVRDPVDRIVSHFWHDWAEGKVSGAIDDVVLRESRFVDYSRYAYQIEPWIREFGPKNVLILRFEEYVASRAMTLERTLEFLGVPRLARPEIDERVRENARDERRVTTRTLVGSLARSRTDRASKGAAVAGSDVGW